MNKDIDIFKGQARRLQKHLKALFPTLSYSQSLEAVAALHGAANWRTLQGAQKNAVVIEPPVCGSTYQHIFKWPFLEGDATKPTITQVLLTHNDDIDWYYPLTRVNGELLELLAEEGIATSRGESVDKATVQELEGHIDYLVLEWGDEYEEEGLSVGELRGMIQVASDRWQLTDGRKLGFVYASLATMPLVGMPPALQSPIVEKENPGTAETEGDEENPRYVFGNWGHLFGPGMSESTVRFVYDREEERIVKMQILARAQRWTNCSQEQIDDVENSLKNANEEALECPEDWGLEASNALPDWAAL